MNPRRGEIWLISLDPVRGQEQGSDSQGNPRPCLIISDDRYNSIHEFLRVVVPITTAKRDFGFSVTVDPPEGGLDRNSMILCDQVRTVDLERFRKRLGHVSDTKLKEVERSLAYVLGLPYDLNLK